MEIPKTGVLRDFPELVKLWSSQNTVSIEGVKRDRLLKVLWDCPNGEDHVPFERSMTKIFQTTTCPVCTFLTLDLGFNDVATTHPHLVDEWSPKNTVQPHEIMQNNVREKILWVGKECGHEWKTTVKSRVYQKSGCNYCNGRLVLTGFNDFATHYPQYVKNWSNENKFKPTEVSKLSNKKILWICDEGHELERSPKDWVKSHCWFCSGRKLLKDFNDLATVSPDVAAEWDYEKNKLNPDEIRFNHREKAFWKCKKCDLSWESVVRSRVRGNHQCPRCAWRHSYLEEIVYNFVKEHYDGVIFKNHRPITNNDSYMELDLWLPEINFAIEVHDFDTHSKDSDTEIQTMYQSKNGIHHKKGPTYHERKRRLALEQLDVTVIDVWEDTVRLGDKALFEVLGEEIQAEKLVIANPRVQQMVERRRRAYVSLDVTKHSMPFHDFNLSVREEVFHWICESGHSYIVSLRQQMNNVIPCPQCRSAK